MAQWTNPQEIRKSDANVHILGGLHLAEPNLMAGRLTGSPAD